MLVLLGVAQLMVILDATIVNIALPSAQRALEFSTENRQWIITAYALSFGSLLLVGGKLGDLFGRKWTFIAGLAGFSLASAVGGLAQSFGMLVAARALQGAFGALLAPSALGLLTVTFQGSHDRAKAFGIFGAIAGGGAWFGLLLGGALTEASSWRWCLYVNLVIAVPAALVALRLLRGQARAARSRIDVPGVASASAGLFALVYGFSRAETTSWSDPLTIAALGLSVVLLSAFVALERRVEHPLLPLHIVWDRARGGAYASIALAGSAVFAVFRFLTYYMQQSLGFSPLRTGLGFLPMTGMIVITATTVQTRVLHRTGARTLVMSGMAIGALAMLLLTRLPVHGSYAGEVLPSLLLTGLAMGCIFAPGFSTVTLGVKSSDAGIASAMVNTSQEVGGSVGTALLSTLFAGAAAGTPPRTPPPRGSPARARSTGTPPRSTGPPASSASAWSWPRSCCPPTAPRAPATHTPRPPSAWSRPSWSTGPGRAAFRPAPSSPRAPCGEPSPPADHRDDPGQAMDAHRRSLLNHGTCSAQSIRVATDRRAGFTRRIGGVAIGREGLVHAMAAAALPATARVPSWQRRPPQRSRPPERYRSVVAGAVGRGAHVAGPRARGARTATSRPVAGRRSSPDELPQSPVVAALGRADAERLWRHGAPHRPPLRIDDDDHDLPGARHVEHDAVGGWTAGRDRDECTYGWRLHAREPTRRPRAA